MSLLNKTSPEYLNKSFLNNFFYNEQKLDHKMVILLVCNKFNFSINENILKELNEFYKSINFAPNAILSLTDGAILHINNKNDFTPYFLHDNLPELEPLLTHLQLIPTTTPDHIMKLVVNIRQIITATKTFEFDIVKYIQDYYR